MDQSTSQRERQRARDIRTGHYLANTCEACGKGAPMYYFSHPAGGPGLLVLCGRRRCPGTVAMNMLDYDEALAYVEDRKA